MGFRNMQGKLENDYPVQFVVLSKQGKQGRRKVSA